MFHKETQDFFLIKWFLTKQSPEPAQITLQTT